MHCYGPFGDRTALREAPLAGGPPSLSGRNLGDRSSAPGSAACLGAGGLWGNPTRIFHEVQGNLPHSFVMSTWRRRTPSRTLSYPVENAFSATGSSGSRFLKPVQAARYGASFPAFRENYREIFPILPELLFGGSRLADMHALVPVSRREVALRLPWGRTRPSHCLVVTHTERRGRPPRQGPPSPCLSRVTAPAFTCAQRSAPARAAR